MQSIPLAFYYHAFTFGMSSVVYTFKILQKYSDYMTITKECKIISARNVSEWNISISLQLIMLLIWYAHKLVLLCVCSLNNWQGTSVFLFYPPNTYILRTIARLQLSVGCHFNSRHSIVLTVLEERFEAIRWKNQLWALVFGWKDFEIISMLSIFKTIIVRLPTVFCPFMLLLHLQSCMFLSSVPARLQNDPLQSQNHFSSTVNFVCWHCSIVFLLYFLFKLFPISETRYHHLHYGIKSVKIFADSLHKSHQPEWPLWRGNMRGAARTLDGATPWEKQVQRLSMKRDNPCESSPPSGHLLPEMGTGNFLERPLFVQIMTTGLCHLLGRSQIASSFCNQLSKSCRVWK